ncbi:hypothetical protein H4R22_003303, partial [Coemansia sp. RSA 1290]
MNYLEKLKSKFEQLSMSGHSGSAQPSGNSGGYPGGSYNARQQQPMYPPSHWQAPQPPNQGYPPPHPGGPGGFYAPPPGMQPYGYGPPGGQGYPPPNQAPMFYPQDGANTQAYPPTQHGEQLPMVPPRPPRAGPEPTSSYPPSGMAATTEQQGEGKLDRSASAEVPAGVPLPLDQHDIYPADADGNRKHISGNQEGSMLFLNVKESEMVHQRFLIVYGQVPGVKGANDRIVVRHPYFPPLSFPAVDGYFKVLAELENGDNALRFEYLQGNNCIATGTLNIKMSPYLEKPPLILAVVLGRDSQGEFDAPPNARGPGRNDLDAAIRKFRCCAYLWQAFVAEQLHRQGFGRRTFRLEESYEPDTMARDNMNRMTAKVHVIRSRRTVAEIRDKERAQQWCPPPGYKRHTTESQFSLANEAIDDYGVFKGKHFIVCLSLDAHWDPQLQVILGHAALGGGTGTRRLGVFGSHTTHAWPANAEEIAEKFLDTTKTDTRYLANDAKECGEYWRAANIGMGAFLHECGHLLTLAHTPSGIMSRGFNDFNRTFMARAPNFQGPVRQRDEAGAHWHRTDIIRLRHHVLLRLPSDPPLRENEQNEAGFELLAIEEGLLVRSQSGITMIEVWVNGHYRNHIEYTSENLPRRRNGSIMADRAEMATAYPQQVCLAIGVGSLQLAYIVKQSGWIGTTFIVFAAGIAFLNAVITIKCMYLKPGGGRIVGYHNIGFEAFGNAGYYTITVFNIVNIIGSIGIYVILASNNISDMFAQANVHISPRTLMIASATVMCMPTLFAKTLAETMLVSLIGTLTSVIVTVVVIVMACLYPIRNGENPVGNYTGPISHSAAIPGGFAMALSSVTFAYLGTTIVPHIEGGMRHPEKFNRVFGSALSVIAAIYVVMAATGYWAYGDQTMSPITDNFPKTWPTTLAEICITIHVLFAGPLYLVQMSLEIESGLGILQKKPQAQRVWRMAVRIGSALVILAIAEAIPFFDD